MAADFEGMKKEFEQTKTMLAGLARRCWEETDPGSTAEKFMSDAIIACMNHRWGKALECFKAAHWSDYLVITDDIVKKATHMVTFLKHGKDAIDVI